MVATPIGNLADLSLRAIHVLGLVDLVACEDTRHSSALLVRLGIEKPLLAVHEHNERAAASSVIERLAAGQRVAYVSDAGTPAVSDPGAVLVDAAQRAGYRTIPVPGASSVVTALSVAGDFASQGFAFAGFLPPKGQERVERLRALLQRVEAQVLFEAPHRVEVLASLLQQECPGRMLTVCRELTKQFETVETLPAGEFASWLAADADRRRGEFVLVLHGVHASAEAEGSLPESVVPALGALLEAMPLKQAASLVADLTGLPRKRIYQRALELKAAADSAEESSGDDEAAPTIAR